MKLWLALTIGIMACSGVGYCQSAFPSTAPLDPGAASDFEDDRLPSLAVSGAGTVLAAWQSEDTSTSTSQILVSRGTGSELSWIAPISLTSILTNQGQNTEPRIAFAGGSTWIVVWESRGDGASATGTDADIYMARSLTDGETWQDVGPLHASFTADAEDDRWPDVACDGSGTCVAVWSSDRDVSGAGDTDRDLLRSISLNNGETWSDPIYVNASMETDFGDDLAPALSYRSTTGWGLVWRVSGPVEENLPNLFDINLGDQVAYYSFDQRNASGNIKVHWGESWAAGDVDMSSQPNFYNSSVGPTKAIRSEGNLLFGNNAPGWSGIWQIPITVQESATITDVAPESASATIREQFANRLFQNQVLDFPILDYEGIKGIALLFGEYYSTDETGNIYAGGIEDEAHLVSIDAILNNDADAVIDGDPSEKAKLVFIDTIDGNPPAPDFSNLTTISVAGSGEGTRFMRGYWFINAHFDVSGIGSSYETLTVETPPEPGDWVSTVAWPTDPTTTLGVISDGMVRIAGNMEVSGQPGFAGILITHGAVTGSGTPNVFRTTNFVERLEVERRTRVFASTASTADSWSSPTVIDSGEGVVPRETRPDAEFFGNDLFAVWDDVVVEDDGITTTPRLYMASRVADSGMWTGGGAIDFGGVGLTEADVEPTWVKDAPEPRLVWSGFSAGDFDLFLAEYDTATETWNTPRQVNSEAGDGEDRNPAALQRVADTSLIVWSTDGELGQGLGEDDDIIFTEGPITTIHIADAATDEGQGAADESEMVFVLTAEPAPENAIEIAFSTRDSTATSLGEQADYVADSGVVRFESGETSKTLTILVLGDNRIESDEIFFVDLGEPSDEPFVLGNSVATGTIRNDDAATVSVADAEVQEGNLPGLTSITFSISLTAPTITDVVVNYATMDGTAVSTGVEADFEGEAGQSTIPAGEVETAVNITVNGDEVVEDDESFVLNIELVSGFAVSLDRAQATGTILNDDISEISIGDVTLAEGDAGLIRSFQFPITISPTNPDPISIDYATFDGSATVANSDYTPISGALNIPANTTAIAINVSVRGDDVPELSEDFFVNLSGLSGNSASLIDAQGTGTILNDDFTSVRIEDLVVLEDGDTSPSLLLTANPANSLPFTLSLETIDGSATVTSGDYGPLNLVVEFPAGQNLVMVPLQINSDSTIEGDETFHATISAPSLDNVLLERAEATITITEDDFSDISFESASILEGDDGTASLSFDFRIEPPNPFPVVIEFATQDGTATSTLPDRDFQAVSGTLLLAEFASAFTIIVHVEGDTEIEPDETLTLDVSTNSSTVRPQSQSVIGTILNDDEEPSQSSDLIILR